MSNIGLSVTSSASLASEPYLLVNTPEGFVPDGSTLT